ncbi:hypothetical protein NP493_103g02031 [Ridgeia piscesae]|uniref:SUEL-type lectin domain-containing protein n=1 Tax=Ridgeia piscesae TaxID=27915 RepID=A0AAD9P7C5_RIDPI|nr:hypothetical protein NP493_103g02031 [Ridgeia piscesae]
MAGTNQILAAVSFLLVVSVCTACTEVYEEEPFCVENGKFSMKCPTDHMIIISDAVHRVVKTGPCPTDFSSIDACTLSNVTKVVSKTCQKKNSCSVSVSDSSTACSGYTGNKFVTVTYKCEPEFATSSKAVTTNFCNDISWEGSLAYLNNLLTPPDATRCICTVTVPQNVNVDVKGLYNDGNCASFVNMLDEEDKPTDFCLAGELQCKDGGRQLHFEYIPSSQSVSYLSISVSHKASFKLQCKKNPATTTAAQSTMRDNPSTATPTTTASETTTVATTELTTQTTTTTTTKPTQSTMHENPSTAAPTTNPPVTTTTESTTTTTKPTTTSTTTPTQPPKVPMSTAESVNGVTTAALQTTSANIPGANAEPQKARSGLAQNIVIGIGVAAMCLVILIMVCACVVCYRRNKKNTKSDVDPYYATLDEPKPKTESETRATNDYDFSY